MAQEKEEKEKTFGQWFWSLFPKFVTLWALIYTLLLLRTKDNRTLGEAALTGIFGIPVMLALLAALLFKWFDLDNLKS